MEEEQQEDVASLAPPSMLVAARRFFLSVAANELVALAVELADDPNGGVQVRVLADSNVVSGVTVVPLRQSSCCG